MRYPGRIVRVLAVAAAAILLAVPSDAYYHSLFTTLTLVASSVFVPVPEAFDLTALPDKTVTFFVSDAGLAAYGPNDSFGAVLSQVKSAAAVWNSVSSSDLRVCFGGLETYNANQVSVTPGGDVVFAELAPGILGLGTFRGLACGQRANRSERPVHPDFLRSRNSELTRPIPAQAPVRDQAIWKSSTPPRSTNSATH